MAKGGVTEDRFNRQGGEGLEPRGDIRSWNQVWERLPTPIATGGPESAHTSPPILNRQPCGVGSCSEDQAAAGDYLRLIGLLRVVIGFGYCYPELVSYADSLFEVAPVLHGVLELLGLKTKLAISETHGAVRGLDDPVVAAG